jgi:hypothetical protein
LQASAPHKKTKNELVTWCLFFAFVQSSMLKFHLLFLFNVRC